MNAQQLAGARQVLTAAALTYVAAALIAVLQLLYYMGLAAARLARSREHVSGRRSAHGPSRRRGCRSRLVE